MMHPDTHERRRSLNIERFAAAREWNECTVTLEKPDQAPFETIVSSVKSQLTAAYLIRYFTRWILATVITLAVVLILVIPLGFGVLPNWQSVLGAGAVIGMCVIAWGMAGRND